MCVHTPYIIFQENMHTNECESLKNTDSGAIIAEIFLRNSLWLLLLDLGNCHKMFLVVEFVYFEDGFDFGKQLNGIWWQGC